jgi:xanthine dehydrogenase small subunit
MAQRGEIRFLLNDGAVALDAVAAEDTLLDFLRIARRLTGTKEGCAEGDCGACTVLVGRLAGDGLRYEPVNACIRFLASVDRCHVVTVEHLRGADGGLHPVQQAMVDHHASQCGFCTPGIVMALAALRMDNPEPDAAAIDTALQGNLCRCTGYAPILRAARAMADHGSPGADPLHLRRAETAARLRAMADGRRVAVARGASQAILPADADDLAAVLAAHPEATIVAGATDVGLWVTKGLRQIAPAVFIGHLDDLRGIERDADWLRIGASVTYAEAGAAMAETFPHLRRYWDRIGGPQVRAMGTLGGNIANGSPIGDIPPALIPLGAEIVLRAGDGRRVLPLEEFFIAYGKQDIRPGGFLESIRIPVTGGLHAAYKISKRRDEDISAVAAGFHLEVSDGAVRSARIAFGGMAPVPKRARAAEAALIGQPWAEASLIGAAQALDRDFTPISDMRASAVYRMTVAKNLFRRFWHEHGAAGARAA